jgi:hypothetical protein
MTETAPIMGRMRSDRTEHLAMTDKHVTWVTRDRHHTLELLAERAEGG